MSGEDMVIGAATVLVIGIPIISGVMLVGHAIFGWTYGIANVGPLGLGLLLLWLVAFLIGAALTSMTS